jgi:hypothetical protein
MARQELLCRAGRKSFSRTVDDGTNNLVDFPIARISAGEACAQRRGKRAGKGRKSLGSRWPQERRP